MGLQPPGTSNSTQLLLREETRQHPCDLQPTYPPCKLGSAVLCSSRRQSRDKVAGERRDSERTEGNLEPTPNHPYVQLLLFFDAPWRLTATWYELNLSQLCYTQACTLVSNVVSKPELSLGHLGKMGLRSKPVASSSSSMSTWACHSGLAYGKNSAAKPA